MLQLNLLTPSASKRCLGLLGKTPRGAGVFVSMSLRDGLTKPWSACVNFINSEGHQHG